MEYYTTDYLKRTFDKTHPGHRIWNMGQFEESFDETELIDLLLQKAGQNTETGTNKIIPVIGLISKMCHQKTVKDDEEEILFIGMRHDGIEDIFGLNERILNEYVKYGKNHPEWWFDLNRYYRQAYALSIRTQMQPKGVYVIVRLHDIRSSYMIVKKEELQIPMDKPPKHHIEQNKNIPGHYEALIGRFSTRL